MDIKKNAPLLWGLLPLLAAGCSTYKENFDCPVGEGVRCASLSTINKKLDRGEILVEEEPLTDQVVSYGSEFIMNLRG